MAVIISRNAKNYQERKGLRPTMRGPGPIWNPEQNAARAIPLSPPLPLPELQHDTSGQDPPDGPLTKRWPHGETPQV